MLKATQSVQHAAVHISISCRAIRSSTHQTLMLTRMVAKQTTYDKEHVNLTDLTVGPAEQLPGS